MTIGIGILSKRNYSGFPPPLRSFWQRVRDDGGTMFDFNSAISAYRSSPTAILALSPSAGKDGTLYSVLPSGGDGDFTVSRASDTATRINKDGYIEAVAANVPRINYSDGDPVLLTEPAATNLIAQSEAFGNSYWTKSGATIDDNGGAGYSCPMIDSSGGNTLQGFKLVESVVNQQHKVFSILNVSNSTNYNCSLLVKSAGRNKIGFYEGNITAKYATFDLNSVEVISLNGINAEIKELVDDWYHISYSSKSGGTSFRFELYILSDAYISGNPSLSTYQGDGTSGVYIFGAQLETGSTATSYIQTTGTTETRNADDMQVDLPSGVTSITLTDKDDVESAGIVADPYVVPVGEWKSIIME